jgi:hypothetical protein
MMININNDDIIYELFKLSSVVLPEKNTWSLNEILERLIIDSEVTNKIEMSARLKKILKDLEEKQAVVFVNEFEAISLVEPKLQELVNLSKHDI